MNFHSWGQAFIWPFNGREPNDIQVRTPGYLDMFKDIAAKGGFVARTLFGNSAETMGKRIFGDADDYVMSQYGIPSVTAELGLSEDYVNDWLCKGQYQRYNILNDNYQWVYYIL